MEITKGFKVNCSKKLVLNLAFQNGIVHIFKEYSVIALWGQVEEENVGTLWQAEELWLLRSSAIEQH